MKKLILNMMCLVFLSSSALAQLNVQVSTTSVSVNGLCDLDGWPNGDSDPQWDIDVSDNRTYDENFSHESSENNGPNITVGSGYDNSLNFNRTYSGICPPAFLTIDWSAFDDDPLGTDARFDQTYLWTVPTTAGVYNLTRTGFVSDCGGMTWTINLRMTISGVADYTCADNPCDAFDQVIQDPCDAALNFSRYDVSSSTQTIDNSTTPCSYDGDNDIFFKFEAPASGQVTVWVDDWGDFATFGQGNLTGNIMEGNCNALGVAGATETVTGTGGGPHSTDCIDFSRGLFNDINNGPFTVDGLTPGQTYFMRTTEEDDQSAYIDLAFSEALVEDDCINAQELTGVGCNYNADVTNEITTGSWTGQAHVDADVNGDGLVDVIDKCNNNWYSNENLVWYYFDVTNLTPQPITVTVNSIDCVGGGNNMQMGIWRENGGGCAPVGGAATGNGLGSMLPVGCSYGPSGIVEVTLPDNMPDDRYYVVVDGDAGSQCRWEFESLEVLPVEMEQFSGEAREKVNVLDWKTLSETNNSHFEVERTTDPNKGFEMIGEVEGNGNSSEAHSYTFVDEAPMTSGYYRLKQVDFDGKYEYTEVIHILRKDEAFDVSSVFPNPTTGVTRVKYVVNEPTTLTLSVMDMLGRTVVSQIIDAESGIQIEELDMGHLANGVYTLSLDDGNTRKIEKLIKE